MFMTREGKMKEGNKNGQSKSFPVVLLYISSWSTVRSDTSFKKNKMIDLVTDSILKERFD